MSLVLIWLHIPEWSGVVDQDEMVRILGMETYILPLGCLHRAKCEFNTGLLWAGQEMNELCEVRRFLGNRE